jgi:hypothetical protein
MSSKLQSDVIYNLDSFLPKNNSASTQKLNKALVEKRHEDPMWWEVHLHDQTPTGTG